MTCSIQDSCPRCVRPSRIVIQPDVGANHQRAILAGNRCRAAGTAIVSQAAIIRCDGYPVGNSQGSGALLTGAQIRSSIHAQIQCAAISKSKGLLRSMTAIEDEIGIKHGPVCRNDAIPEKTGPAMISR